MSALGGKIKRWKDGDILWIQNDFVRIAYTVTDDASKIGTFGFIGPNNICAEYIGAEAAKKWEAQQ